MPRHLAERAVAGAAGGAIRVIKSVLPAQHPSLSIPLSSSSSNVLADAGTARIMLTFHAAPLITGMRGERTSKPNGRDRA